MREKWKSRYIEVIRNPKGRIVTWTRWNRTAKARLQARLAGRQPAPEIPIKPKEALYKVTVTATVDYPGEAPLIMEGRAIGYAATKAEALVLATELQAKLEASINDQFNSAIAAELSIDNPIIETTESSGKEELIIHWRHNPAEASKTKQMAL